MSHEEDQKLMESLVAIQRAYWQPNPDEKARLLNKYPDALSWPETLRLHHLACLDLLSTPEGREQWFIQPDTRLESREMPKGETYYLCQSLARRLMQKESPYRTRPCAVWQGPPGPPEQREPDMMGLIRNASLTHLGGFEVIHTADQRGTPTTHSFVPFDDVQAIIFARSSLFRAAMIYYDDGRPQEVVWMPLQYGFSWFTTNPLDHDGSFTRFCCHIDMGENEHTLGIGIGHQDFLLINMEEQDKMSLFGLGSIKQLEVALVADDPKLEQKCLARGMDPAQVREFIKGMHNN